VTDVHQPYIIDDYEGAPSHIDRAHRFSELSQRLLLENTQLTELAEMCREIAQILLSLEADLDEQQRGIDEAREQLSRDRLELSTREAEITRKLALADDADRRLREAQEKESYLATIGNELLERFGAVPGATPPQGSTQPQQGVTWDS
jgi:chromosome segregation ATPase